MNSQTSQAGSNNMINTFLLVLGYGLLLYVVQFFISQIGMASVFPGEESLNRFDASIYKEIAKIGYTYPGGFYGSNSGWYILFPWLWRLSHLGVWGISLLNLVIFAFGFTVVTRIYPISTKDKLLWLSTPSLYFMLVPYSEALFCLLTALSFYGIVKRKRWLIWASLFLVSLTRATAVFLIPALFLMELLTNDKKDFRKVIRDYLVNYAFPTLAGLAAFVWYQHYKTGVWFVYFKFQTNFMDHKYAIPVMPFSNFYGGNRVTWLGALAMCACIIALVSVIARCYKWLFKNVIQEDKILVLTLAYLPVILYTMLFFNPKWGTETTNILGLHRYVFCTPFIFVFLFHFTGREHNYRAKHFIAVLVLCNIVWLSMGSYLHIQRLLFYNFNTFLVFGYMLHANKKTEWATYALIAINVFFQINLFQHYLQGLFTD